jgi:hypothetical protein
MATGKRSYKTEETKMKALTALIAAVLVSGSAVAQSVPVTSLAGHALGETLDQWLVEANRDMAEICGKHKRMSILSPGYMDFKQVCSVMTLIRSGQPGSLTDARATCSFVNGRVSEISMRKRLVEASGGQIIKISADEQFALLSSVYGPPSGRDTVINSNLAGGTWHTEEAWWNMPDGALVIAIENMDIYSFPGVIGPTRSVLVTAVSAESRAKSDSERRSRPNPYL